jgi:CheY-like chemotaxis protein
MRPLAEARAINLSAPSWDDANWFVKADRQRLKQVLLNLLTNAVKYTPIGGSISVSCAFADDDRLRLSVIDTGPGIPADKLDRLFTPFDRLGAEQSGIEGTGLGLALSRRLMHAMRGSIGVHSAPRQGSTFWIELARAKVQPALLAEREKIARSIGADTFAKKRTLLYIEDNLSNVTLVEHMLADLPEVELFTAPEAETGLILARQHLPDLILLDLHLPDVPGWEVLSRLKADETLRDVPVVVISADATARQIERLMRAGAREYLTKPLNVTEFYRVIHETMDTGKENNQCAAA